MVVVQLARLQLKSERTWEVGGSQSGGVPQCGCLKLRVEALGLQSAGFGFEWLSLKPKSISPQSETPNP